MCLLSGCRTYFYDVAEDSGCPYRVVYYNARGLGIVGGVGGGDNVHSAVLF